MVWFCVLFSGAIANNEFMHVMNLIYLFNPRQNDFGGPFDLPSVICIFCPWKVLFLIIINDFKFLFQVICS